MRPSRVDQLLLAVYDAGDEGVGGVTLRAELSLSRREFRRVLAVARRRAATDLRAIIPRSVYPDYRYRLVDRDNPNVPAFIDGIRVDTNDMVTRLVRVHLDATTALPLVDGRTREGKLVHIIAKQVGRACEDIADAQNELTPA